MKGVLKNKTKMLALLAAAVLTAVCLFGCAGKNDKTPAVDDTVAAGSVFPEGTTIGGRNVSGKSLKEAQEICRDAVDSAVSSMEITVKFKDDAVSLSKNDFYAQDVLEFMLPRLLTSGEAGDFELPFVIDIAESGMKKLEDAAKNCFVEGKDASVASFDTEKGEFVFTDEVDGTRVDMLATLKSIRQLLSQKKGGAIQAAFIQVAPKVTRKTLSEDFQLMSAYTTTSTNTWNGNSNMALALSHVNGTVMMPGDVFSYNNTIGDSTNPNAGWLPAGGLVNGLHVQVYGGGICQGSTTLYNAALMAGMEIVERECHSTPSTYCPVGLDATVDYGSIDFRFRNPLDNPVYIAAWMDDVVLHVNFYGIFPDEWDRIEVESETTSTTPPLSTVNYKVDENLAKGTYSRLSTGYTGYTARAWRTFYKGDKVVKTEDLRSSTYPATGMTYAIGPDTDKSKVDTTKETGTIEGKPTPAPSPTPDPEENDPGTDPTPPVIDDPDPDIPDIPDIDDPPYVDPTPDSGGYEPDDGEIGWD